MHMFLSGKGTVMPFIRTHCLSLSFEAFSSDWSAVSCCVVVEEDESAVGMLDRTLHPNELPSHDH